jgi:hypothetical protein
VIKKGSGVCLGSKGILYFWLLYTLSTPEGMPLFQVSESFYPSPLTFGVSSFAPDVLGIDK